MNKQEFKRNAKKVWWFIWESNSIWSWIVNIILAFIIIKFLVYPGLGLILTTSHPIVAVVSGSMEHDGSFEEWWDSPAICGDEKCTQEDHYKQYNITKRGFLGFKFKNGFNKGDIMVLKGANPEDLETGEILVFISSRTRPRSDPIIHRVIDIEETEYGITIQTKGDHNTDSINSCDNRGCLHESDIRENQLVGKAVFKIPYLGYIKIGFVELLKLFIQR